MWWPAWPTSMWRCSTWRWWTPTATSGTTSFNVVLNAPHFTVVNMVVEDGGNGILESEETANLVFTILNDGHDAAPGAVGILDFDHPDVHGLQWPL